VAEGGWLGLSAPAEYGGQGLPVALSQTVNEFQCRRIWRLPVMSLTMGATAALNVHGKPESENMFVPRCSPRMDRHHEPHRPQMRTDLGLFAPGRSQAGYGIQYNTRDQDYSSLPAARSCLKTLNQFIASLGNPPAIGRGRCSWCRRSSSMRRHATPRATACRAVRLDTRWHSWKFHLA